MAGLTSEGFTAKTLEDIKTGIKTRLNVLSPNFDFSVESPDGQFIEIVSFELFQLWNELAFVFKSYDPNRATGAALRNLGLITGIIYGAATRSQATIELIGTAETEIPKGSIVTDTKGQEFKTQYKAKIPASMLVVAVNPGVIELPIGSISVIKSPIDGWASVSQPLEGRTGTAAQTDTAFRNIRNKTVLRNATSVDDTLKSRLHELGLDQVSVVSNESSVTALPDGTPTNTIQVVVNSDTYITDEDVARVILESKPLACATYGSTVVTLNDSQGNPHTINFNKANNVDIYINVDVSFLDEDNAGALEDIEAALVSHILEHQVGEDVIFSRLYGIITPFGKAEVVSLEIGLASNPTGTVNITISDNDVASTTNVFINITEV